jgi:hypothetical protein
MRPGAKSIQHGDADAERFGEVARTPLRAAGELLDFADDEDRTRHRWEERSAKGAASHRVRATSTNAKTHGVRPVGGFGKPSRRDGTCGRGCATGEGPPRSSLPWRSIFFSFTICRLRPTFQTPSPTQQATIRHGRVIAASRKVHNRIQTPRTHHGAFRLHLRSGETVFVVKFDDRIRRFRRGTVTCSWRSGAAASFRSISCAASCFRTSHRSVSGNGCTRSPRTAGCMYGKTSRGSVAGRGMHFRLGVRSPSRSTRSTPQAWVSRANGSHH